MKISSAAALPCSFAHSVPFRFHCESLVGRLCHFYRLPSQAISTGTCATFPEWNVSIFVCLSLPLSHRVRKMSKALTQMQIYCQPKWIFYNDNLATWWIQQNDIYFYILFCFLSLASYRFFCVRHFNDYYFNLLLFLLLPLLMSFSKLSESWNYWRWKKARNKLLVLFVRWFHSLHSSLILCFGSRRCDIAIVFTFSTFKKWKKRTVYCRKSKRSGWANF